MRILQTPQYSRWTESAIDCYKNKCICRNCDTYSILGNRCRMKEAVLYLVKTFGVPKNDKN